MAKKKKLRAWLDSKELKGKLNDALTNAISSAANDARDIAYEEVVEAVTVFGMDPLHPPAVRFACSVLAEKLRKLGRNAA